MGSPIRVLHTVVNMNRGGAETLLMNLYRNIDRKKIQFDFLTSKPGVFDEEIKSLGGTVYRIPYVTDVGHKGYVKALNHFFMVHPEYTIVHSHMDKMSGLVLKAAKENNIKHRIAHSHNTSSEGNALVKIYKWFIGKEISNNATHYLACSNQAAKWLYRKKANKARIIRNGIIPEEFIYSPIYREQIRAEFGLNNSAFVMGHIGRFNVQKNHTFLLDIFSKVVSKDKSAYLLLVGDGALRKDLEKKINQLKIEKNVIFAGVRSDISRILHGIDLFVFPSLHEGLPVTLIEAQGASVPCLISDVITREVDMGLNLIQFLSLNNKEKWIEHIELAMNTPNTRFSDSIVALQANGYDIRNTASWTEGFYSAI
ncbi:glycosyltransferase family 1 protein [Sutcliffiella rhizosphaerae]|uniref:Glycosyltransferase EpsF n=1 Tax=Sutcliffiella rhizosphaerae TaxID=2880967 RepID=A0ABM8YL94_9BACI|nr:glycosyltransferase family 1 protein [Sutcliffiella rhizosphaerae]CAG9620734.1 Putative glycosyltransferase EpsF [Sutcliffiella rhizosphaerae]